MQASNCDLFHLRINKLEKREVRPVRDVITVGDNSGSMIFLTCRRSGCKRNSSLVWAGSLVTGGLAWQGDGEWNCRWTSRWHDDEGAIA